MSHRPSGAPVTLVGPFLLQIGNVEAGRSVPTRPTGIPAGRGLGAKGHAWLAIR
jgi:hypothetical protein